MTDTEMVGVLKDGVEKSKLMMDTEMEGAVGVQGEMTEPDKGEAKLPDTCMEYSKKTTYDRLKDTMGEGLMTDTEIGPHLTDRAEMDTVKMDREEGIKPTTSKVTIITNKENSDKDLARENRDGVTGDKPGITDI